MCVALATSALNGECLDSAFTREGEPGSISVVADHDNDLCVWDLSGAKSVVQREHV